MKSSLKEVFRNSLWWFLSCTVLLLLLLTVYLIMHSHKPGGEIIKLTKQETIDISNILDSDTSLLNNNIFIESKKYAYNYLFSIHDIYSSRDSILIRNHFDQYKNKQAFLNAIANFPIKIKSYFWLTGDFLLLEIIFWTLFGVIANLLYNVSESMKSIGEDRGDASQGFKESELPVHWAKLLYAPLSAIIITLSISALSSEGDISLSEFHSGQIVLSFILGFFSGRTIDLLNRIKDLILPLGKSDPESNSTNSTNNQNVDFEIVFADNKPTPSTITTANITLRSLTDTLFSKIVSANDKGKFFISNLIPGDYLISVNYQEGSDLYNGFKPFKIEKGQITEKVDVMVSKYAPI